MSLAPAMQDLALCSRRAALGALAAGLAGCVPAPPGVYYRPETRHPGAAYRPACQRAGGPVTAVTLDLGGGMRLDAVTGREATAGSPTGTPLRIELTVPAGVWFQFAGPVRLLADGRGVDGFLAAWAERSIDLSAGPWFDPQQLRPGNGPAFAREDRAPFGTALLRFRAPRVGTARAAEGLRLEFDQRSVSLPPLEIARVGETRPAGGDDDVRWSARLHRSSDDTLQAEVELLVRRAGRWRVVADDFRARDASGGAGSPLQFTGGSLAFADRLGAAQPVRPAPTVTRVHLDAVIPAATTSFDVQLPPLRRGEERVTVQPIRFERRTLDRAPNPFNC